MALQQRMTYARDDARITVLVAGVAYAGWLQSEVDRNMEAISGTFNIPVSLVPGSPPAIARQDPVQIRIGSTVVMTGFVLSAEPFYRGSDCGMRITGRDRTGDLVRCSAIHQGGQWRNAGLDQIARDLVAPFSLQVAVDCDIGAPLQDFKLAHGETVLDALARAARLRGVMVTRDSEGRLLLTKAGTRVFAGQIIRGQNVISMEGVGTDDNRHSHYFVYGQSNTVADFEAARGPKATARDEGMTRYLPLVINADGNITQAELQALASHTARVRYGHSQGIRYTVEGWTWQGQAWPINERVAVFDDVAGLDGQEWLICSTRQTCDLKAGDTTEMLLRPIEAYDTAPLKTRVKRRNWGNAGNQTNHKRGPSDRARD